MQIKLYTIPIIGGDSLTVEMNVFLCSKKILQVENHLIRDGKSAFWCFCIKYIDSTNLRGEVFTTKKVDYKALLDEKSFTRFSKLREIRKKVAQDDAVPAYAVFTDEELAGLARLEVITLANMKSIQGIGQKKVEKYSKFFILDNEESK